MRRFADCASPERLRGGMIDDLNCASPERVRGGVIDYLNGARVAQWYSRGLIIRKGVFLLFHLTCASVISANKIKALAGSAFYLISSRIASFFHKE